METKQLLSLNISLPFQLSFASAAATHLPYTLVQDRLQVRECLTLLLLLVIGTHFNFISSGLLSQKGGHIGLPCR